MSAIRTIVRKELLDANGNRWLYLYAGVVALLGIVIAETGIQAGGAISLQVFGRTTATLVNLCLFLAPLVAVTLGSGTISAERDQGTLEQLLAQPITRSELLIGKYLGLWAALFAATLIGFAPAGILIGLHASFGQALHFLLYPLLSQLLISVMLAIGILISVRAKSRAQANAVGIAVWFVFVLAYDILLMGSLSIISLPADALAGLLLFNPVDSSRILSVITLEPDLYALGPAGAYLVDTFSSTGAALLILASLAGWVFVPLVIALRLFNIKKESIMNSKKVFRLTRAGKGPRRGVVTTAVIAMTMAVVSCGGASGDTDKTSEKAPENMMVTTVFKADTPNLAKGQALYQLNCAPCHGKAGKGDGPAAANLNPRPRNHTNGEYMNKLTDDHIGNVIRKGGAMFGYPNMPAHPQFKDEEINALIAQVRSLAK